MYWLSPPLDVTPAKAGVQGRSGDLGALDFRLRGNDVIYESRMNRMDDTAQQRIAQDIADHPVVLFMKGSPVFPQCGFSAAVVQMLSHLGVKFKGVDVLADPAIRQGIKEFSSWPTIPQLYVKGEFIGGCDIVREMFETGELQQVFEQKGIPVRA
jgi:monothiol glutaredoxin